MPEYLAPGVYVEETSFRAKSIEGVGTSTTAFIGPTRKGPVASTRRNADGTRHPSLPVLLDVDNLIDYMLVIFYTGDGDAPLSWFLNFERSNNWFGLRDRNNPNAGFRFFNHDAEHTLGAPFSQVDRTGPYLRSNQNDFTFANPQWIHQDLTANAEYRLRFADHAQRHFFNGGVLKAPLLRRRITEVLDSWLEAEGSPPVKVLENADLDLAVSRGAAR